MLLVAIGTAFPVYINTYAAIRGVDDKLVEAGTTFGLVAVGPGAAGGPARRGAGLPGRPALRPHRRLADHDRRRADQRPQRASASSSTRPAAGTAPTSSSWAWSSTACSGLVADGIVRFLERTLLAWRRGFVGDLSAMTATVADDRSLGRRRPGPAGPAVVVEGLSRAFDGRQVLAGVDLTIAPRRVRGPARPQRLGQEHAAAGARRARRRLRGRGPRPRPAVRRVPGAPPAAVEPGAGQRHGRPPGRQGHRAAGPRRPRRGRPRRPRPGLARHAVGRRGPAGGAGPGPRARARAAAARRAVRRPRRPDPHPHARPAAGAVRPPPPGGAARHPRRRRGHPARRPRAGPGRRLDRASTPPSTSPRPGCAATPPSAPCGRGLLAELGVDEAAEGAVPGRGPADVAVPA